MIVFRQSKTLIRVSKILIREEKELKNNNKQNKMIICKTIL